MPGQATNELSAKEPHNFTGKREWGIHVENWRRCIICGVTKFQHSAITPDKVGKFYVTAWTETPEEFVKELTALINKHSLEKRSNTPDFILAQYLVDCLAVFDRATQIRVNWYE